MPAEVLVMCGECGRPQAVGSRCVACGAALPAVLNGLSGREPANAVTALLEADLGRGRVLALSSRRLEWRPGPGGMPLACELTSIKTVALRQRPVYEGLLLVAVAVALWSLLPFWARVPLAVLGALGVVGCFAARRFRLSLHLKGGSEVRLPLGISRCGAPLELRIASGWKSLVPELRSRGVGTEGGVGR